MDWDNPEPGDEIAGYVIFFASVLIAVAWLIHIG